MDIAITKMSSKGQIVIPQEMRESINPGEKLIIIKSGKQMIMRKMKEMEKILEEDLEFAKRTEEAWQRYDKGEFISMDSKDFLKELEKW